MEGHAYGEIVGSVPAAHGNAASRFGQSHGDDAAEATRAAGYDCDASREIKAARLWQRTVSPAICGSVMESYFCRFEICQYRKRERFSIDDLRNA
jgi:hypothetical protein